MTPVELSGFVFERLFSEVSTFDALKQACRFHIRPRRRVILRPDTLLAMAFQQKAEQSCSSINATCGRKARSIIVMRSNHVVLSSLGVEAIKKRFDRLLRMLHKSRQDPEPSLFDKKNTQKWE